MTESRFVLGWRIPQQRAVTERAGEWTARVLIRRAHRRPKSHAARPSIFIHIPRCAGTSLKHEFRLETIAATRGVTLFVDKRPRNLTFDHLPLPWLQSIGLLKEDFVQNSFLYTVVRDPYTRAASMYRQLRRIEIVADSTSFLSWLQTVQRMHSSFRTAFPLEPSLSSPEKEWLSGRRPNMRWMISAWPQVTWTAGLSIDVIGRFERLNKARGEIAATLGQPLAVVSMNSSRESTPENDDVLYCDAAERLVAEIYAADFESFGYPLRRAVASTTTEQ
jgi:hypothetical protein